MNNNKNQLLKDAMPVVLVFLCFLAFIIWKGGGVSFSDEDSYHQTTGEFVRSNGNVDQSTVTNEKFFDVNSDKSIWAYLTSKKFKLENRNIKFLPDRIYEMKEGDYLLQSGTWEIGERIYETSVILHLTSEYKEHIYMLSDDGKLMDKNSFAIYK